MVTDSGVLGLGDIKRAVSDALDKAMVPMHYADLTELALTDAGISARTVDFKRQKEDVREKILQARQNGMFYVGSPLCMGAKVRWFRLDQRHLLVSPDETVRIPGDIALAVDASVEAQLRSPLMIPKTPRMKAACEDFVRNPRAALRDKPTTSALQRLFTARTRGLVSEAHVSKWFREQWPSLWVEKSNVDDYERPCSDDFRLMIGGRLRSVDVMGPNKDDEYANPGGGKRPATYHVLCRMGCGGVVWERVVRGEDFASSDSAIPEFVGLTAVQMTVYLNCVANGIDYGLLRRKAMSDRTGR
jgi:hypothetical protein